MLIVQGERDPFENGKEVATHKFSKVVRVEWMPDGDHSLTPRKSSGRTEEKNRQAALDEVVGLVRSLPVDRAANGDHVGDQ